MWEGWGRIHPDSHKKHPSSAFPEGGRGGQKSSVGSDALDGEAVPSEMFGDKRGWLPENAAFFKLPKCVKI